MNAGEPHHHMFFTVNVSSTYVAIRRDGGENACPGEEWSPASKGGVL